ncbi:MAG: HEAT repeat domain-containing protein [Caldilineaceae bacterium]
MGSKTPSAAVKMFLTAIANEDDVAAEAAVSALSADDEPTLLPLCHAPDFDTQWWALRALGACGGAASLTPLIDHVNHQNTELRSVALMALGQLAVRHPTAMQPHFAQLTERLTDADGLVRQVAADALAQCGNPAIPALIDVLRYHTDQAARSRAAYALGKIATMEAAPALYRCLNDPNYLVHTYAYEALEKMGLLETMLVQL